ncbi:hypothetical protein [Acidiferrobacter thiooxydans]|jgi:hypothetical protein|uniref:hypothetical protein n=1 Tax=Acidiferrobacter thiooxydans TaxID=163359 RepID=UPI001147985F|nr:hypothetical protein [Acidiferrobacter thiooxydans]UEN98941.1 hypothetical protein A9R16_010950 [Acidiferrobacter thiooxydans]
MTGRGFWWRGGRRSRVVIAVSGKEVEIRWSAAADRALAVREAPLIVELELAFACFARKTVRFAESSTAPSSGHIRVTETLLLRIVTRIPDACTPDAPSGTVPNLAPRPVVPRWVGIDRVKGAWVGESGW